MTPLADAVVAVVIVGTPPTLLTLWMLLLNRRDRRRAAIAATVGGCCRALGLSGMVALDVSAGVWTRRARVTLDMRLCAAADIWRMVELLRMRLPRGVTLRIVVAGSSTLARSIYFHRDVLMLS
jgi:hypothetical protein